MKPVRLLLIMLGVVTLVGVVGLGLALTPAIQRRIILHAAAGQPGLKLGLDYVSAGFSSLKLSGMRVEQDGLAVQLPQVEADYSLWQLIFKHRLAIGRLAASGILVDASRVPHSKAGEGAAAVGVPVGAPGLLAHLKLPVELVLDDCQLEGRALLPGAAGKPPLEAEYKITGGKFAPGQEGTLLLVATLRNGVAESKVAALHVQLGLRATQTVQKTFSRVGLTAVVEAEGKIFSGQNQLKVAAELGREASGENYSFSIDTLLQGVAENLLAVHAVLPAGGKEYAGDWTLKARMAQLAPFSLGAALPEFHARGEGRFTFDPVSAKAGLQGGLQVDANGLEAVDPALRAIGSVKLQGQFDLVVTKNVASLRQLEIGIIGERPVLELKAARGVEFDLKGRRLRVADSSSGEALSLKLQGLPLAWIRPFVQTADISGGTITGEFAVTDAADRVLLRSVQPVHIDRLTVVQEGRLLVSEASVALNAEAALAGKELQIKIGDFKLQTPAGDVLTAQTAIQLPMTSDPSIAISANWTADLPALLAPWMPLGRVRTTGETDFTISRTKLELRRLKTTLTNAAGLALFEAVAAQPFRLDLASRRLLDNGSGAVELLHLKLGRVPLDVLPLTQPGAKLGGVVEQGDFVLKAIGEKLTFSATAPFKLAHVSLQQDGRPALMDLAVEMQPVLELAGDIGMKAQTGACSIRTATGATLLTFQGEAVQPLGAALSGVLAFNLDVPALASQPIFDGAQALSAGRASGEIRATLGTVRQMEARLTLNGLVSRDAAKTLPVANLSFRAIAQANGKMSIQAPLLLDFAGQRSDLNFSLDLAPAGPGYNLDGKLTGERLELEDALAVLGVFLAPADPAPVAAKAKQGADVAPIWSRFGGQLKLDVKSVVRGKDWAMTGLTGLVTVDPARISLQKLEAAFGEKSRLTMRGGVKFETGSPRPYQLGADLSLTEFDAGKFFKAFEPDKPATVEGLFTVTGHFTGDGEVLAGTVERTHGQFELTSRQGVFRGLQRTTGKVSMTSKAVELGASVLGSIFGSDKGTKAAEKVAGQAYFVDQLAQALGEFNYDQLNVRLVRDESLNVSMENISLIAPEIRLIGNGTVAYVADKPLLEQPLSVSLSLAGRGKIEELLGKMRLLSGARDELGYAKTKETVTLGGSLSKPDPTAFFTRIATGKLSDLLAPEN